jgi:hypothetical protein
MQVEYTHCVALGSLGDTKGPLVQQKRSNSQIYVPSYVRDQYQHQKDISLVRRQYISWKMWRTNLGSTSRWRPYLDRPSFSGYFVWNKFSFAKISAKWQFELDNPSSFFFFFWCCILNYPECAVLTEQH